MSATPSPHVFERAVRFEEVDAAGFVYFPRVVALAHEALERLLEDSLERGAYARFVLDRKVGLPCVHVACDFTHPLHFGDVMHVATTVRKFGTTSVTLAVAIEKTGRSDLLRSRPRIPCASIVYVVACAEITGPNKRPLPDELKGAFLRYFVPTAD
ncbi:MAG: hypothetical protein NVS3B20_20730 [Polyangiales bacterium]